MRRAHGMTVLLAAAFVLAAGAAPARAEWPLWDGKESIADYAKRAGIKDVQTELDLGNGTAMKLTLIPAGRFIMGMQPHEVAIVEGVTVPIKKDGKEIPLARHLQRVHTFGDSREYESPPREVTISQPFYMGVYEVTQEQYVRVMGAEPGQDTEAEVARVMATLAARFRSWRKSPEGITVGKDHPVGLLTWEEAADFCAKLSTKIGRKVSLPTEAQWEYACRAGSTTFMFFGDDPEDLPKYTNVPKARSGGSAEQRPCEACGGTGRDKAASGENLAVCSRCNGKGKEAVADVPATGTTPVGSFLPNNFGLYDMAGNASEYCSDWCAETYASAPTVDPAGPGFSPPGTCGGPYHITRGGIGSGGRPMHSFPGGPGLRVVMPLTPAAPSAATGPAPTRESPKKAVPQAATQAAASATSGRPQSIVHEATGIEMVYVPAGEFFMGSPESEKWAIATEWPQHRVTLSRGIYMGKTEVTQGQWERVMGGNPSRFKDAGPEAPVEMVSWDDCQAFCKKAGGGLRLPTEAEWEYACRAGTRGPYAGDLDEMGWYLANSEGTTRAVGTKKPNAWGLYDMHGNVWEWCFDMDGGGHFANSAGEARRRAARYPAYAVTDPAGPNAPGSRIVRGGSWGDYPKYCRSAERGRSPEGVSAPNMGFRVVLDAAGGP